MGGGGVFFLEEGEEGFGFWVFLEVFEAGVLLEFLFG